MNKKQLDTTLSVFMKNADVHKPQVSLAVIDVLSFLGTMTDENEMSVFVINGHEIRWYKDDMLHRDGDKPAVIYAGGDVYYHKNGNRHRDGNKPAVIYANGAAWYYKNGKQYWPAKAK